MKRFHVHIGVKDLDGSVRFYSKLFGVAPSKQRPDYAKWMLDDPRINFAISSRGHATGVNHFGIQADSAEELEALRKLADAAADGSVADQGETSCCYAKSVKHWTIDPQGLAWEHFLTVSDVPVFGEDNATESGACCIPLHGAEASEGDASASCCVPRESAGDKPYCCG